MWHIHHVPFPLPNTQPTRAKQKQRTKTKIFALPPTKPMHQHMPRFCKTLLQWHEATTVNRYLSTNGNCTARPSHHSIALGEIFKRWYL